MSVSVEISLTNSWDFYWLLCDHLKQFLFCVPLDYTQETFSWPEYLAKTGGIEAPPQLFRQVRISLVQHVVILNLEVSAVGLT